MKFNLSLCLFTNEPEYVPEWLDWHRMIGVDHFFIYDNLGCGYPASPDVTVESFVGLHSQLAAYDHCLMRYGSSTQWLGFIDIDEFIVPKSPLKQLLKYRHNSSALAMSWKMFGNSGWIKKPPGGVVESYTAWAKITEARHVKCLVQPEYTLNVINPHQFSLTYTGCHSFSGTKVAGAYLSEPEYDIIQLNHYWTKSLEEWTAKVNRPRGDGSAVLKYETFFSFNNVCIEYDDFAFRMLK